MPLEVLEILEGAHVRRAVTLSVGIVVAACFLAVMRFETARERETADHLTGQQASGTQARRAGGAAISRPNDSRNEATQRAIPQAPQARPLVDEAARRAGRPQPVADRPDPRYSAGRPDELPLPKNRAFEVIRERFLAQPRDPRWSTGMESRIFDKIADSSAPSGFIDIQVECRATLCRVQLSHAGETRGDRLTFFSVTATMHGYRLRNSIENDLGLDTLAFDSGFVAEMPVSLLYLERESASDAVSE